MTQSNPLGPADDPLDMPHRVDKGAAMPVGLRLTRHRDDAVPDRELGIIRRCLSDAREYPKGR